MKNIELDTLRSQASAATGKAIGALAAYKADCAAAETADDVYITAEAAYIAAKLNQPKG